MKKINDIILFLDEIISDPKCELNYNKDYELLIAVMLSAQTTDKRVNMVTGVLFNKYSSLQALNNADIDDIMDIIKPIGTFRKKANNIKSIAKALLEVGETVPNDRSFLENLDGVGRKTTNVVLSILYKEPYIAVDTHVSRVSKRLGLALKEDDVFEIEQKLYKVFNNKDMSRLHHQLVLFGRYFCKAKKPKCTTCKLKRYCTKEKN